MKLTFVSILIFCISSKFAAANDEVFLVFYHGSTTTRYTVHDFGNIFDHVAFRRNVPTTVFSYGNLQTLENAKVVELVNAYLSTNLRNFVAVDYSLNWILDGGVQRLGEQLGFGLRNLFNRGYNSGLVHLIGFGTAAHIVSVASLNVQLEWHFISRVTGLSPTFTSNPTQIGPNVAQFVDTIHTNTATHGNFNSRGMASFLVNGGERQPYCGEDEECSHDASMIYWAESVFVNQPSFPSLSCDAWSNFCSRQCDNNQISNMGQFSQSGARGLYFLQTNNARPFSRNVATPLSC